MKNAEFRLSIRMASLPLGGAGGGLSRWLPSPLGGVGGGLKGLTEPFLWIQLVAEGSLSKRRRLGVAMAKARYNFIEGSAFQ